MPCNSFAFHAMGFRKYQASKISSVNGITKVEWVCSLNSGKACITSQRTMELPEMPCWVSLTLLDLIAFYNSKHIRSIKFRLIQGLKILNALLLHAIIGVYMPRGKKRKPNSQPSPSVPSPSSLSAAHATGENDDAASAGKC